MSTCTIDASKRATSCAPGCRAPACLELRAAERARIVGELRARVLAPLNYEDTWVAEDFLSAVDELARLASEPR